MHLCRRTEFLPSHRLLRRHRHRRRRRRRRRVLLRDGLQKCQNGFGFTGSARKHKSSVLQNGRKFLENRKQTDKEKNAMVAV